MIAEAAGIAAIAAGLGGPLGDLGARLGDRRGRLGDLPRVCGDGLRARAVTTVWRPRPRGDGGSLGARLSVLEQARKGDPRSET